MQNLIVKIKKYNETYFDIYICLLSLAYTLGDIAEKADYFLFKLLIVAAFLFMGVKIAFTGYEKREMVVGGLIFAPLIINFIINKELKLFMFFAGIVAAKNVNINKVFKHVLIVKVVSTTLVWSSVLLGIIENKEAYLLKNEQIEQLNCYGYFYPNVAYANFLSIAILLVLLYHNNIRWYIYVMLTSFFVYMYYLLYCRTGIIIWLLICILIFFEKGIKSSRLKKNIYNIVPWSAMCVAFISIIIPILYYAVDSNVLKMLNSMVTGRIDIASKYISRMEFSVLGQKVSQPFDNVFVHVLYNDGVIYLFIYIIIVTALMLWCNKKEKYVELLMITSIVLFSYMEFAPLTLSWCPVMLLAGNMIWDRYHK